MLAEDREARVARLVAELASIRRRGVEHIDVRSTKQQPVGAPELDQLADQHAVAGRAEVRGRVLRLKHLFRSGLAAWQRADPHAAQLVRDVLLGESAGTVTASAGDLLRAAMRKAGQDDERRFRATCHAAFHDFAEFLISYVDDARTDPGPDPAAADLPAPGVPPGPDHRNEDPARIEVEHHQVSAGYVGNRERFVELLAAAANATIVGVTNEHLALRLEAALERKRAAARRPDAFWNSLRVVFLREDLLDHINDERPETPDRTEALRQRRLGRHHGRRSVNAFMHRAPAARWEVYESPFLPPVYGSLFELPGGSRIVQVIRHPQRGPSDHLYLEFADTAQQYFTAAFEEVIHSSTLDTRVVLLGVPHGDGFRCSGVRFRYHVLRDGSGAAGWLPAVLVITWRRRAGEAVPLLQLRLPTIEFMELYRLSPPGLLIHQHDLDDPAPGAPETRQQFNLHDASPARTARRRLRMDTGTDLPGELLEVTASRYLHADKEHLFYFVFSYEFPADFPLPRRAELHQVPLPELLAIRQNQTLRQAANLCQARSMSSRAWAAACEIAALNLALDGHAEQGRRLARQAAGRGPELRELATELAALERRTRQETWTSSGEQITLAGLSGLQYREFYTVFLPVYAQVGVPGAAELRTRLDRDRHLRTAIGRLATLYQDEEVMSAIPVEL